MTKRKKVAWFVFKKAMDVCIIVSLGLNTLIVVKGIGLPAWFAFVVGVALMYYMDTEYIQRKDRGPSLDDYLPEGEENAG